MTKRGERKKYLVPIALGLILIFLLTSHFIWSKEARIKRRRSEGEAAWEQGNYTEAARFYDYALKINPDDRESLLGRARSGLKNGETEEVKAALDKLGEQMGDSPEYKKLLYDYALMSEDYTLAASLLGSLPDYSPGTEEYRKISEGLFEKAFYTQAEMLLDRARKAHPKDLKFAALSIKNYLKLDKNEEAAALYEQFRPELESEYLNKLGAYYAAEDEHETAIALLTASLEQDLQQEEVRQALFDSLVISGDTEAYWEWRQILLLHKLPVPETRINLFGNTAANVRYRGFLASQNGISYFADPQNEGLYITDKGGGHAELLRSDIAASSLNIRGKSLFYVDRNEDMRLKRLYLEEGAVETLCGDRVRSPLLWGDVLYFINESDNNTLHKIELKTGAREKMSSYPVKEYAADGSYLYFISAGNGNLYRQAQDASPPERLLLGNFSDLNLDEFSVIYMLDKDMGGIVSCRSNGSHKTLLLEGEADYLNYADGKLYYVQWTPHSVDTDGRSAQSLASNFSSELIISGEWIYSFAENTEDGSESIYRFRKDGTDWTKLETDQEAGE